MCKRGNRMIRITIVMGLFLNLLWGERFELSSYNKVYDNDTELLWLNQSSEKALNFEKANAYCKALKLRLPSQYELKSLVDYSKYKPAIGTKLISVEKDKDYWSSSSYYGDDEYWTVYFLNGIDLHRQRNTKHFVLCVE